MSVPVQTIVIATPCVPTLKDPTFVDVSKVLRVMEETAQVKVTSLRTCFVFVLFSLQTRFHYFLNVAVPTACSPSCGPNAFCPEGVEPPSCVCSLGYQGDGYNCTGSYVWEKVRVCCTFNSTITFLCYMSCSH